MSALRVNGCDVFYALGSFVVLRPGPATGYSTPRDPFNGVTNGPPRVVAACTTREAAEAAARLLGGEA